MTRLPPVQMPSATSLVVFTGMAITSPAVMLSRSAHIWPAKMCGGLARRLGSL